jgi:hypothetical protein
MKPIGSRALGGDWGSRLSAALHHSPSWLKEAAPSYRRQPETVGDGIVLLNS